MKNSKIYPWVVVGLLWGVALLNYMDRQMLSTMRDAMAVDITELQSAANFGRLMGVFLWIYGCMSPIAGMVGDRMNRKWLIVGSLFVWSAVTYLMGIADTYNEVFFLRALMGISEALYIPAGLSLIADYHSDKFISHRYSHDRALHRAGHRRFRRYSSRCFFLAYNLSLVRHRRHRIRRNFDAFST